MNVYSLTIPWLRESRPWIPWDESDRPQPTYNFASEFLTAFERLQHGQGWTVHITYDARALPSYGPRTIAVLLEDESARHPLYAGLVRAVFKTYGTSLPFPSFRRPTKTNLMGVAHWCLVWMRRAPYSGSHFIRRLFGGEENVFDIPLGYFKQLDLPRIRITERKWDVGFAGSVEHKSYPRLSIKRYVRSPKVFSRESMIAALGRYAISHPEASMYVRTTASFRASRDASTQYYSESLRDTKICVVPRGASFETYRWYEGLRYGCVVICERLPKRRYYDGAPCHRLADWNELPALLDRLLGDPVALMKASAASTAWWEAHCDALSVARFMSDTIQSSAEIKRSASGSHARTEDSVRRD